MSTCLNARTVTRRDVGGFENRNAAGRVASYPSCLVPCKPRAIIIHKLLKSLVHPTRSDDTASDSSKNGTTAPKITLCWYFANLRNSCLLGWQTRTAVLVIQRPKLIRSLMVRLIYRVQSGIRTRDGQVTNRLRLGYLVA